MARPPDSQDVGEEIPANPPVIAPLRRGFPRPFGRYILEKNLSRGGMGEVHLAVARGIGNRCVIKTIRGDLTGDKEFIGRFADEAKIMVRIGHPNIIRVFDCGKVGTDYYIAMEYVHGRDLGDVLDRAYEHGEPVPKEFGLFLTREILRGLEYAHALTDEQGRLMRLVHRDISPQNVLVGFDGSVKLIDFGLARTELLPARTQGALAVGKYGYMSPEQARHERIDGRADLYSTGVMLFEVFTGDRLVDEQDQATLWARVLSPKHRRPSTVIPGLPKEIDELIMTAVAVRAEDRFEDARAMLRYVDSMKTKPADRAALVEYLRHLYPTVDFSPPPLPDLSGEVEIGEQSMVFAMSEEGAKSVFGRGQLPIEWTRQFKWADVQAEIEKKKKVREGEPRKKEGPVPEVVLDASEPMLDGWDDSSGTQEATAIHEGPRAGPNTGGVRVRTEGDSDSIGTAGEIYRADSSSQEDSPTTIASSESFPEGTLAENAPTRYERRAPVIEPDATARLGRAAIGSSSAGFRDDEQTVMMSAPPRGQAWAGEAMNPDDVVAPTKVTRSVSPTTGRNSGPPTAQIQPNSPAPPRRVVKEKSERAEGPRGRGVKDPAGAAIRAGIGNEPTAPAERNPPPTPILRPKGTNLMLLGIGMMGIAIVVLLLILIFWS